MLPKGNFNFKYRNNSVIYSALFNPFSDCYSILGTGEVVEIELMENLIKDKQIEVIRR